MMFPLTSHPQQFHAFFETAGISTGAFYYRWIQHRDGVTNRELFNGKRFAVLLGCIFGAAVGNKLVFWIEMPQLLPHYWGKAGFLFAGQSIVGGLLGGLIGVELAKRMTGEERSTGDAFVFPILLGLIIGRIGCFVAGLDDGTYGVATTLPWGVDFGDGIPRHPTQIYEMIFAALLWAGLKRLQPGWSAQPGLLFKGMLCSYLLWRLLVDAIKPVPFDYILGLSGIQVVCAIALLIYTPVFYAQWQRLRRQG